MLVGAGLVHKEIERSTVLTLLAKPVRRSEFLAGKFLGMTAMVALVFAGMTAFLALVLWLREGRVEGAVLVSLFTWRVVGDEGGFIRVGGGVLVGGVCGFGGRRGGVVGWGGGGGRGGGGRGGEGLEVPGAFVGVPVFLRQLNEDPYHVVEF